jgi:hypothetical protein
MKDVLKIGLILMGAIALGIGLDLGSMYYKSYTAETRGKSNAEAAIESAPSRMANYDHFFDLCASIQGYEAGLATQRASLDGLTGDDLSRTKTVIAGISAQRSRSIAQYNADARKEYTSARFLSSGLPKQINDSNSEKTSCVN